MVLIRCETDLQVSEREGEVVFFHVPLFRYEGASAVEASKVSFSAHNFINARQFAAESNTKFKPHRLSILLEAGFVGAPAPHDRQF